ncbi:HIT family protein [Neisseria leonii]|uniref:HIT family protein n=1 Tax=Neisseria leonii TaxID=2995413 RepID=UPI00237A1434|nr:HIT domain-containing protein [Neisseria sp. 3986]MDD9325468.1 HIT domain-containing protein [Neisseria sp. 3986]
MKPDCPICCAENEEILLQTPQLRVIALHNEPNAPAFCRVIWQEHTAEMTDLAPAQRALLMETVYRVEAAMRTVLRPVKINLASLGNVVPHLHWHIIARFENDACFPAPVWTAAQREAAVTLPPDWQLRVAELLAAGSA